MDTLDLHFIFFSCNIQMFVFPDDIIERQIEEGMISPDLREKISFVLLRKHRHQTKKPIHRSLADIGKSSSSTSECASSIQTYMSQCSPEFDSLLTLQQVLMIIISYQIYFILFSLRVSMCQIWRGCEGEWQTVCHILFPCLIRLHTLLESMKYDVINETVWVP